ncbi:MotA/TolQ/ExbB proton channel family protein [Maribellus comscasis]|uniref:MotA/TolQ/ExbB proton channel family protein n=1 Tax=Maribellus comscasis TaxID=2681766 RepID=A0A6I6K4L8_9BACT|nr:MotA/TolQ/ExbB proton channel family protein [Maribellus comscasis]QGY47597.1 MotA/TolQ/ExbB proton channel family protein [Maribellus comscasis]
MDIITNWLYWLTTGLLVPVIVFLLIFFVRSLLLAGKFYGIYVSRSRTNQKLKQLLDEKPVHEFLEEFQLSQYPSNTLIDFIDKIKKKKISKALLEKLIGDYEILADADLGKSKSLTKLGPMLGLMGTLIPMGPALTGLANGDVATMAHNMQVAFATTVIGVFIGAIGFITLQIEQRWYADDLNTLEYITGSLLEKADLNTISVNNKKMSYEKETVVTKE